jgi:predicted acetyltransferase
MKQATDIEVRPPSDDRETDAFLNLLTEALFPAETDIKLWHEYEGHENFRVALRGSAVVGGFTVQHMGQWFGGRAAAVGCVRAVGVAAEHRAGGVGAAIMCAGLEELHREGIPLASLYPATQPVYRRPGYEQAGVSIEYRCATHRIQTRDRTLDMVPIAEGERSKLATLHSTRAKRTAGNLERNAWLFNRITDPPPWLARTKGYWISRNGKPEGYVYVARSGHPPQFKLNLVDYVTLTADAGRRLLTFLADHRSVVDEVSWRGAAVDPLCSLMVEQPAQMTGRMDWMLRLVNVSAALEARGYSIGLAGEVHLEVVDDVLRQNNGRFFVQVADGRAQVTVGGKGDARIDVRGLAALYSGHQSPYDLLHKGQLEADDGVLRQLAGIFAGPAPWMSDMF